MPIWINDREYVIDLAKFSHQAAQTYRTYADEGGDFFERSVGDEALWKRTQYNWELGAGQEWLDRRSSDRSRFYDSIGINPYEEGKLSLYNGGTSEGATGISDMCVAGGYLYCLAASSVKRAATAGGSLTNVSSTPGSHTTITTDGNRVWIANGSNIYVFSGTGASSVYSTFNAYLVGYANGRLIATDNGSKNALYEIQDNGATSTLIWEHPNSNFVWRKIVHAPNGIYLVGDAGSQTEIYKMTVADSTGNLVPPFPAVEMEDEVVYNMVHYGGLFVATTNRGVRLFAIADASGHLTYGKVIEFENGSKGLATRGEDVYAGWGGKVFTKSDGTTETCSGVAHLRLTEFTETLVPGYVFGPGERSAGASDDVEAVAYFDGAIYWTVNGALYSDTGNPDVGYIDFGAIEFGSIDGRKRLVAGDVRHEPIPSGCSVELVSVAEDATELSILTSTSGTQKREVIENASGEKWNFHLVMTPNGANGPVVERWTIEGVPVPPRIETILLPIILKEKVVDEINDTTFEYNIWEEYEYLETLVIDRSIVTFNLGSRFFQGYIYDIALAEGDAYGWDTEYDYIQGIYHLFVRTIESSGILP